jgi:hypothetical protein
MAYGTRPYGIWAYGFGPYSTWRLVDLGGVVLDGASTTKALLSLPVTHLIVAALGGRSGIAATAYADIVVHVGPLTGQSGVAANLRLYWEPDSPCDATWAPDIPCDAIWAPAAGCDAPWVPALACITDWAPTAGSDASWVVQPPPPLLCPDALEVVDG